jgi:hypothetical protein
MLKGTHDEAEGQAHTASRCRPKALIVSADLIPAAPRIRLRIGVSGHRVPPKLPNESVLPLRAVVDSILAAIVETTHACENDFDGVQSESAKNNFNSESNSRFKSEFAIVSALAEGSDRIVAEAGLAAGYTLEAVLPFARAEYARDFAAPESLAAFQQLLETAAAVFELDGAVDERTRAYQAAGFVMLANIDLLIAIWDGEDAAGEGGTAQTVSRAITDGIPVIRLDPKAPRAMEISWSQPGDLLPAHAYMQQPHTFRPADEATVGLVIQDILSVPDETESLPIYLAEKERHWNFCLWYPLLLFLFGVRLPRLTDLRLPPALADTQQQWQSYFDIVPKDRAQRPSIETILLPAYSAADHLGVFYSLVYRGTYVFSFSFAAIAVMLALFGVLFHEPDDKIYVVIVEFVIICSILITWRVGIQHQWHRRWLEYRRLAECLRHMRILAPLGTEGPINRPGVDVDGQDWVSWYAWSLRRLIPLPDSVVDHGYVDKIRKAVCTVEIAGQTDYHITNAGRLARLETRMHITGQVLFALTGLLCFIFFGLYLANYFHLANFFPDSGISHDDTAECILRRCQDPGRYFFLDLFTFLTALLPTLGAALGAIGAQGDFRTRSEQSERTATRLEAINQALTDEPLDFARLADRVQKTSDIMMADLEEWQTVFRTRPLSLPA